MGTKTATASSTLMSSSEDSLAFTQPLDPPSSTSMTLMEMVDLKTRKTTPCTSDLTTSGTSSPPTRTETASTQFLIPMLDQTWTRTSTLFQKLRWPSKPSSSRSLSLNHK